MQTADASRSGLFWAVLAFLLWGVFVFYFKALGHVPPMEILAHRIVWSVVFLALALAFSPRRRKELRRVFRPRLLAMLSLSTVLIATNWFTFIWAVTHDRILQASLGYYINPLFNVLLGLIFLGERLSRARWLAVGLAAIAVSLLAAVQGRVPTVALVLAVSFGFYGLLRKTVPVGSLVGLLVETTLLFPLAGSYLVWLGRSGQLAFLTVDRSTDVLLLLAGAVTAVPLLCFAAGARRIDYSTIGVLQYLAPSIQFLIAVLVYGEALQTTQLVAFGLIWAALVVYGRELWRGRRARREVAG